MNLCDYLKHNWIKLTTFSKFPRKIKNLQKNYILSVIESSYRTVQILFILIILLCSLSVKHLNWHTVETGMKKNSDNLAPICLQQVVDAFFFPPIIGIIVTVFTGYQVDIKFWTKVSINTHGSAYATAGIEAECHFVPWSLI